MLTSLSRVLSRENPVRAGGSFPLVKPIIVAVTSRLLTGLVLSYDARIRVRRTSLAGNPRDECLRPFVLVRIGARGKRDKPRFDHRLWWCYGVTTGSTY